jgi:hypothetical protein
MIFFFELRECSKLRRSLNAEDQAGDVLGRFCSHTNTSSAIQFLCEEAGLLGFVGILVRYRPR